MTVQVKVVRRGDDYRYECGRTVNGLYFLPIGCHHLVPSDAHRHADRLAEPSVSPLRSPAEGSPVASVPPSGAASVEPSAGARKHANRRSSGRRGR